MSSVILTNPAPLGLNALGTNHPFVATSEVLAEFPFTSDLTDDIAGATATFTRATAKIVNKDSGAGAETFAIDAPAYTGSGILIEGDHTNLVLRSQNFLNASWAKTFASVNDNATTDPTGGASGDRFNITASSGRLDQTVTITSGADIVISVYAKKDDCDYFIMSALVSGGAHVIYVWFDLNTGTVGSTSTIGSNITVDEKTIEDAGSGWYLCKLRLSTSSITSLIYRMHVSDTDALFDGDNGDSCFLFQATMMELTYHLSSIGTASATATVQNDVLSIDATGYPKNNIVFEFDYDAHDLEDAIMFQDKFGASDLVTIGYNKASTYFYCNKTIGGSASTAQLTKAITVGNSYHVKATLSSTGGVTIDVDGDTANNANTTAIAGHSATAYIGSDGTDSAVSRGVFSNFKVSTT